MGQTVRSVAVFLSALATGIASDPSAAQDFDSGLDAIFSDRPGQPGCLVGLIDQGQVLHAKGYGRANLDWNVPLEPDTVFELGSAAKQFTAIAVLMLEADGALRLSDGVRRHLPDLPPRFEEISLDQMMRMTSGLPDYLTMARLTQAPSPDELTRDSAMDLVAKAPSLFPPGADYAYSNTNYLLLADVVAKVSGQSFDAFLKQRLFAPLGMTDSSVTEASRPGPRRAAYYAMDDAGPRDGEWRGRDAPGAWGARSSLRDLARYNAALNDGSSVLGSIRAKLDAPSRLTGGEPVTYAAGLFIGRYRGAPVARHSGRSNIEFMRFPRTGRAVAVLCNRDDVDVETLVEAAADVFAPDTLAPAAPIARASDYAPFVGDFLSAGGEHMQIHAEDGTLRLSGWGPLRVVEPGVLTAGPGTDDLRLRLEPRSAGLLVQSQSSRTSTFERFTPATPTLADLRELEGRYASESLGIGYTVTAGSQGAMLVLPNGSARKLEPLVRDRFDAEGWRIAFQRNASHEIASLTVATSRTAPMTFRRTAPKR